ncbi:MAG: enoyl-CoA hydratase/isomerase family protein [Planctomycetes bacterium]|nr:enoyl-CoA hydratase/isomerase family protein [Planctomycetota bacterium]MCH8965543.1 enoyl-CoA hydratase/isomerase family protein [Planctomycetota bacterium]MCH8968104.1 enoyl-CoA hydratase/isomerase family protein [Planctomycetota bacterium]
MAHIDGQDPKSFNFENILFEKKGRRATVTINRPGVLNCVNLATLRELQTAFQDASWDDGISVVVLTGAGDRAFCTGADLKEQKAHYVNAPNDYWKWMGEFCRTHELLRAIGKPTVARLNGVVVGGGNEFNMSCDLAVAADDIFIKQVGAAMGSVAAAGATQWLPLIVGDRRAREILMLCEEIPIQKALEWGLVNKVVPRSELDSAVDQMCQTLEAKLPECMRYTKQQLNFWKDFSWHMTIGHARDWLAIHNRAPEVQEGCNAFLEKRPVDYDSIREKSKW